MLHTQYRHTIHHAGVEVRHSLCNRLADRWLVQISCCQRHMLHQELLHSAVAKQQQQAGA
jgi:hypothetical protein